MLPNAESYHEALADPQVIAGLKDDAFGWNSTHPWFAFLIERQKPGIIVEVGSWLGGSAVHMANLCKRQGLETEIYCCDTWLGSAEHWLNDKWVKSLGFKLGYPTVYQSFLKNVARAGVGDMIRPLPLDSVSAAEFLAKSGLLADIIYIDAGHSYDSCFVDLTLYSALLSPRGVILGDDYSWVGVETAVAQYVHESNSLHLYVREGKYVLSREAIAGIEAYRVEIAPTVPLAIARSLTALEPLVDPRKKLLSLSLRKFLSLKMRGHWERFVTAQFTGLRGRGPDN